MHTEASPPAHVPVRRALGQHWSAARGLRREVWVKGSFEADAGRAGGNVLAGHLFTAATHCVGMSGRRSREMEIEGARRSAGG